MVPGILQTLRCWLFHGTSFDAAATWRYEVWCGPQINSTDGVFQRFFDVRCLCNNDLRPCAPWAGFSMIYCACRSGWYCHWAADGMESLNKNCGRIMFGTLFLKEFKVPNCCFLQRLELFPLEFTRPKTIFALIWRAPMLARSMVRGSIWQKMSASQHLSHTMKCERFAALTKSTWYLKYPKMNWNPSYLNSSVTCWDRNLNSKMTNIYDYDSYDMMAIFSRVFQPFKGVYHPGLMNMAKVLVAQRKKNSSDHLRDLR